MAQNRVRLFLENFLVYGMGGMMSRLVPMIMLPIITRLYPGAEYVGLNDLNQTFISFAQALAVCGMYDAMFRVFFDFDDDLGRNKVCSTALTFVCCTSVVIAILCMLLQNQVAEFYFGGRQYVKLVQITALGFLLSATNQIVSAPTRIENKRKVFLVTNTLAPIISYGICIPLILQGHYLYAMPIGTVISAVVIELSFIWMNKRYFSVSWFDRHILLDLLLVGLPLLPNFLIYWLYNSADKIMISQFLGASQTGVYAVASKIGHVSNLIYNAFSGGWLYFAYSTMKDDDQVQLKSNIFEYLSAVSFAATVLVMGFSKLVFQILFPPEYYSGYLAMPYLFIAPLLLMLYQVAANQFSIIKKTYLNLLALSVGALVNLALNFTLIERFGIEGASIATVSGYIVSVVVCLVILKRISLIDVNGAVYFNVLVLVVFFFVWRMFLCEHVVASTLVSLVVASTYLIRYRMLLVKMVSSIRR